ARRTRLWEHAQEEPVTALALPVTGGPCAVGTERGSVLLLDGEGELRWRTPVGASVTALAMDREAGWIAVAAASGTRGRLVCLDADGRLLWEGDLDSLPSGAAMSPDGRYLALSLRDGT